VYRVPGVDKASAIAAAVETLVLPAHINRDRLIEEFLRRESIASTGMGQGVALPHPQNGPALDLPESILRLVFLENPVDFDAPDSVPVQALFLILSQSAGQHLRLLAHLGRMLQRPTVLDALTRQLPASEILAIFSREEEAAHNREAAAKP